MATPIGGCRHWVIQFGSDGRPGPDDGLAAAMGPDGPGDLFVFSPGWNTSEQSARELSAAMFGLIADALPAARRAGTGFVTVLWPSLLFPEDEPAADGPVLAGPRAAHSVDSPPSPLPPPRPSSGAELAAALAPAFSDQKDDLARIGFLLDTRPRDPERLAELHWLASGLVTSPNDAHEDGGESTARTACTHVAFEAMAGLAPACGSHAQGRDLFGTLWDGGRELFRVLSYYEMKNRAGVVGRVGLGPLLARLQQGRRDLRVHLVGHSFGARLVGFALTALPPTPATPVKSLLLVQGAFSHFSFAPALPFDGSRAGALAAVADRVDGPLLATFSTADRAAGWWYPNASRLARQDHQGADEFGYRWGAMGHDGYQQEGVQASSLGPVGTAYDWRPRTFYRLDANNVVNRNLSWSAGAHSDIRKPEIGWAAVTAARLGS